MASLSSMLGGIKSVQRGVVTLSTISFDVNVTISPVNAQKAFCNLISIRSTSTSNLAVNMQLTSSTNLKFLGANAGGPASPYADFSWEVIEFY